MTGRAGSAREDHAFGTCRHMLGKLSRPEIHRAAAASFGVVQVGDSRDYGCLLIRKGVI
ncbi:L-fucose mutarotase/ribose pyranase (RbsD/FucU family) [Bradyrhizobium japonicum]|jgi:L-fucose mutarotase|uniref:hypothetical protein n=1 Tax=Bradyrhizobium TaxID=374 RepID=UPI0004ADBBCA|nr:MULTISPECIES: hypothetical protein [Bradyrhizobium]MDI2074722.1 hypothetical protein [Bradyrhizobium sp. Mp27]